jgi:hypothetical protein
VLDDQESVDVRVLTIDDAHPDDSVEVARKIAARDCVDVTVHAVNKGNTATFDERLLEWAEGDSSMSSRPSAGGWFAPHSLHRQPCAVSSRSVRLSYTYRGRLPATPCTGKHASDAEEVTR